MPQLRALLRPGPGLRLLDLGGGTGLVAELLDGPWAEVVVFEPDARKVAYGRARRPGLRFVEGLAEQLPFPDAAFDRAMALVSLHHMHDQPAALREVRRVLRPGAVLVLHELDPTQKLTRHLRWLEHRVHGPGATHFVGPAELRAMLDAAGFRAVEGHAAPRGYFVAAESPP